MSVPGQATDHLFDKKDRAAIWQTILPGLQPNQLDSMMKFSFGGADGKIDGKQADMLLTEMGHNGALVMIQAKLSFEDRYLSVTAFNTDSSNNQPKSGPFFRINNIEIGRTDQSGNEIEKTIYKAPPPLGRGVTKLFNATGLRHEITPLQMEATAAIMSYVMNQFQAKKPVRYADIAPAFEPARLKDMPAVSSWKIYAAKLAPVRKAAAQRKKVQQP